MKSTKALALSVSLLASVAFPDASTAQEEVVLKGIYLGMPEQEFERITHARSQNGKLYLGNFTLADISPLHLEGTFENGVLVQWHFRFGHYAFEKMRDALKMKYNLKCELGQVRTKAGVDFDHENCIYNVGDTRLALSSRFFDIETASLLITSGAWSGERHRNDQLRSLNDM
jgi:hypothetical protein